MGAVEATVPAWNGGQGAEMDMGEVFFGGGAKDDAGKETEWEVSEKPSKSSCFPNFFLGHDSLTVQENRCM